MFAYHFTELHEIGKSKLHVVDVVVEVDSDTRGTIVSASQ